MRRILPKPSEDAKEKRSLDLTNDNPAPNLSTKLNEKLEQLVMPCQGEESSLEEKCVEPHEEATIDGMIPANIYLLKCSKFNNRNTKKCGIFSKLTRKTPERLRSLLFILNIFHAFSSVSILHFQNVKYLVGYVLFSLSSSKF